MTLRWRAARARTGSTDQQERFLLIRRDNIGDLVLTTPLITALRTARPDAWIGFLANSYNAPVLDGNPHLDAVYTYDKAKHRPEVARISVYASTLSTLLTLRRLRIDCVILIGPAPQRQTHAWARWIAPREMAGFITADFAPRSITRSVPYAEGASLHETEDMFRLLSPFGIAGTIPPCLVIADQVRAAELGRQVHATLGQNGPLIGVQISARRPRQRWPLARFAQTMMQLHTAHGARFMLFWAPGTQESVHHPGEDGSVQRLKALLPPDFPVLAEATPALGELIAGISLTDVLITPDGGAMHLAAGLGKPVIALFGDSPVVRWHPWRVPHEIVQGDTGDVSAIVPGQVLSAWERLAPRVSGLFEKA